MADSQQQYQPPWKDTSIVGIAGSSGSGKTTLALAVVAALNLPWVVILSMDSFYKPLTPEQSKAAFDNEFDFDAPDAIDFDLLLARLQDLKSGKKAEIPIYSFDKHAREPHTQTIYSPHVLILEGIFALHDPRILSMLDLKVFCEADADVCLSRRLARDVRSRGRDMSGCMKQWFAYVKPNFRRWVRPQRDLADIIVPRGAENRVAVEMIADRVHGLLKNKSHAHRTHLSKLASASLLHPPPSANILLLEQTPQVRAMHTLLLDPATSREDFCFYFDRLASLLVERAAGCTQFVPAQIETPHGNLYMGLTPSADVSAVVLLRGGAALETGLRRVIPDCRTGRLLIQTPDDTEEPELHFVSLAADVATHGTVLLLDGQVCNGGAVLMAVRVLVDHGVEEGKIVVVAGVAGRTGLNRLLSVFPDVRVVVARVAEEGEDRWVERRYLGC